MPNTPAGTVDNISIGSGIVYVGDAGVTPTTDVGFLSDEGITLAYETEKVSVTAGFPKVSVREFVTAVNATLTFQSIEWNLTNFKRSVVGTLATGSTDETLAVGVDACPEEVAIQVVFEMPCTGDTITINVWRAQTDGALTINFDNADRHVFDYNFTLLLASEDWAGGALPANEGLFQIHREFAP